MKGRKGGAIKKILAHEVSLLGRRNSSVYSFVEILEEVGICLYRHAQGILNDDGERQHQSCSFDYGALLAEMARNAT
jgi:hypothetical protein